MADFFLIRVASLFTLRTFGAQINWRVISRKVLFDPHRFLSNIHRHGPRHMPNNCKNLNPSYFSLPSTFKTQLYHSFAMSHSLSPGAAVASVRPAAPSRTISPSQSRDPCRSRALSRSRGRAPCSARPRILSRRTGACCLATCCRGAGVPSGLSRPSSE